MVNYEATLDEIKKLSVAERIMIVEEIWDSIARDNDFPELTNEQSEELKRRIAAYHANPDQGRTWDEIKSEYYKNNQVS